MSGVFAIEWFVDGELASSDVIGNEWAWLEAAHVGIRLGKSVPAGTEISCKVSFTPRMVPEDSE